MKILIIGASRGIGKALLECAGKENLQVSVLARFPDKVKAEQANVQIIKGDVLNPEHVAQAVAQQDVVISCIGVPITFKSVTLFSEAAKNLVTAMEKQNNQRLIAVTGIGAGESKGHGGFLYDKLFKPLFLKTIYQDKDREEEIIAASSLDWLIVRPAGLTNGPRTGIYHVISDLGGVVAKRISRLDVADFILKQLKEPGYTREAVLLTY